MKVRDAMTENVLTITPGRTLRDAARFMAEHNVGAAVIMDPEQPGPGIVTERDLVNLVADGGDPRTTKVSERMSKDLDTVDPKTDIAEAAGHMARLKIRHLPVLQDGELAGIISIRDLTNWAVHELTSGHELPDLERSHTALSAAAEVNRVGQ